MTMKNVHIQKFTQSPDWLIDWLIDLNGMATRLGLTYA